ncbi:MGMT family protein [Nocardioides zeae]|uniref:MGMT family protein n=1 Tax=Nocardioides imazamoxiresistens TaxID=3231893 RepID=A0ABU3PYZ0_9ACTN|nr:MGMT family protein [Nocardioides zeae]MDT9594478.1 MGMT family protein [Nocardioides zeae]
MDAEEHTELVLRVVEQVPPGRVTTYGAIAGVVGGGPRRVAAVMSRDSEGLPWWRVVRSDGTLPPHLWERAGAEYAVERTPLRAAARDGSRPVDVSAAFWSPPVPEPLVPPPG